MRNVARGVGLGGLATLILGCAMAVPAVAEIKVLVRPPAIPIETGHSTVGNPTTPEYYHVVPQSTSKLGRPVNPTLKGGNNLLTINNNNEPPSSTLPQAPNHSDPLLRGLIIASQGRHRNQLDDIDDDVEQSSGASCSGCPGPVADHGIVISEDGNSAYYVTVYEDGHVEATPFVGEEE